MLAHGHIYTWAPFLSVFVLFKRLCSNVKLALPNVYLSKYDSQWAKTYCITEYTVEYTIYFIFNHSKNTNFEKI